MRRIRTIPALLSLCLTAAAWAQTGRQVEIQAATEDARADLRGQLLAVYIAPGVMLRDVVSETPNLNLNAILAKAEPVGQPRWVGEDIVQIKLHLMARDLVNAVQSVKKNLATRMSEADFNRFKREWINRSFQATGQAIPANRVRQVVTTLQPTAWVGIPADARADAAARARSHATALLVDQTDAIRIGPSRIVGSSFASDRGKSSLIAWADTLPATRICLRDDRQIEIGMFVDKPGLQDVLKSALAPAAVSQPAQSQALVAGVNGLPNVILGTALVSMAAPTTQAGLVIRQLPQWASDPITAEGEAKFSTTQLRTARAAERTAREALRDKLQTLTIDGGVSLSQAQPHALVRSAINEAVERARVSNVDYHADGSATVTVSLDPNDLLDALTRG